MKTRKTLGETDIVVDRPLGRRSALAAIAAVGLGTTAIATTSVARAKATDGDPQDPPGHGRTGFTDRDSGPGSDGAGRGVCAERGWSDSDPNDAAGRGRGPCH